MKEIYPKIRIFFFKIKKKYNPLKSGQAVRIEITYLTKGWKGKKQKIVGGRINERNKKKWLGRGLDVKRVVCERLGVASGERLLLQKSRMSVKGDWVKIEKVLKKLKGNGVRWSEHEGVRNAGCIRLYFPGPLYLRQSMYKPKCNYVTGNFKATSVAGCYINTVFGATLLSHLCVPYLHRFLMSVKLRIILKMYVSKCGVRVCAVFIRFRIRWMAGRLNMVTAVDVSIIWEFLTILKTTSFLAKALLRGVIQCLFINLLFLHITSPFSSSSSSSLLSKIHLDPTLTNSPSFHVIVRKQT